MRIRSLNPSLVCSEFHTIGLRSLTKPGDRHFLSQGVKPGVLGEILLQQSPLLWVGILGILKAGGAYVPIDSTYPVVGF